MRVEEKRRCSNKRKCCAILPKQVAKEILAATSTELPMILCGPGHAREKLKSVILDIEPERTLRLIATRWQAEQERMKSFEKGWPTSSCRIMPSTKKCSPRRSMGKNRFERSSRYGQQDLARAMEEGQSKLACRH